MFSTYAVGARSGVDADPSGEGVRVVAGALERVAGALEKYPLLRIDQLGFARASSRKTARRTARRRRGRRAPARSADPASRRSSTPALRSSSSVKTRIDSTPPRRLSQKASMSGAPGKRPATAMTAMSSRACIWRLDRPVHGPDRRRGGRIAMPGVRPATRWSGTRTGRRSAAFGPAAERSARGPARPAASARRDRRNCRRCRPARDGARPPDPGHDLLDLAPRRDERAAHLTLGDRRGQAAAIELAVGVERHRVQPDERGRNHVVGQALPEPPRAACRRRGHRAPAPRPRRPGAVRIRHRTCRPPPA